MTKMSEAVKEHADRLLTSMRYMGERAKLAGGESKRRASLEAMAMVEANLKRLATAATPDPDIIMVWKEAVTLMKDIRKDATPDPEEAKVRNAAHLGTLRLMASSVGNVLDRLRTLERAIRGGGTPASYPDLCELGSLMAVITTISATANSELPTIGEAIPAHLLEIFALCSEIAQGAGLCQDLGAKLAAQIASTLT